MKISAHETEDCGYVVVIEDDAGALGMLIAFVANISYSKDPK